MKKYKIKKMMKHKLKLIKLLELKYFQKMKKSLLIKIIIFLRRLVKIMRKHFIL